MYVVDKHLPSTVATLQDAWWMEDERQRQRSQSKVKSECYVKAGRPGLNHGLSRHHRAQVEGVEGLMSDVPQVVTRKGGMPAPCTRLQHLVRQQKFFRKRIDGAIPRVSRARGAGTGSAVPESS